MKPLFYLATALCTAPAFAAMPKETSYVFSTLILLICAALVMWMAAGFCMLESGLVRSKNTAVICLKNILIYSIACICFYVVGYNLMFLDVSGWMGSFTLFANMNPHEVAAVLGKGGEGHVNQMLKEDYSSIALVFFQMTFVAAAASVISGTVAERVRLWGFFAFIVVLTAFIYPIQGSWSWGGGWLAQMGFTDFAGSTVVHSVGGWAALVGAWMLGPRRDKYSKNGEIKNYFPSNVPLVTLGVFILWFGWLGFNGGSLITVSGAPDIAKMALIFTNTNIASSSGAVCALLLGHILYGRINILLVLNGALAGLVSITAGPDLAQPIHAILIGGIGSCLATLAIPVLDKWRIDDVVGAIPVHLVAGIWGTLAVGIWGSAPFMAQLVGVLSVGAFVSATSFVVWYALKKTIGIRVSEDHEDLGQDLLELGIEVDPDPFRLEG